MGDLLFYCYECGDLHETDRDLLLEHPEDKDELICQKCYDKLFNPTEEEVEMTEGEKRFEAIRDEELMGCLSDIAKVWDKL